MARWGDRGWKKLLRTVRNRRILHLPMERKNESLLSCSTLYCYQYTVMWETSGAHWRSCFSDTVEEEIRQYPLTVLWLWLMWSRQTTLPVWRHVHSQSEQMCLNTCSWSEQTDIQRSPCISEQLHFTIMSFNELTSNAKSWPLQTQIPDIELSLSDPNKHIDANEFFRILSSLWYIPGSDIKHSTVHNW